nr:myb/SANT-like domain-containing protein [Tanacetum cinerariifolium]
MPLCCVVTCHSSPSMQKEDILKKFMSENHVVYGRDRATGLVAEGYEDAIHNLEVEQNAENRGENLGFNANFRTMANAVANAMTNDNTRKKAASKKLKDLLDELMKLDIPNGDVLHAGEIFATNKDKMDLFMNLSKPLRVSYVLKLMSLSSSK